MKSKLFKLITFFCLLFINIITLCSCNKNYNDIYIEREIYVEEEDLITEVVLERFDDYSISTKDYITNFFEHKK